MVAMQQILGSLVEVGVIVFSSFHFTIPYEALQPLPLHQNSSIMPCQRMTFHYVTLE